MPPNPSKDLNPALQLALKIIGPVTTLLTLLFPEIPSILSIILLGASITAILFYSGFKHRTKFIAGFASLILISIFVSLFVHKNEVTGYLYSQDKQPVDQIAVVAVDSSDYVATQFPNKKGKFSVGDLAKGEIELFVGATPVLLINNPISLKDVFSSRINVHGILIDFEPNKPTPAHTQAPAPTATPTVPSATSTNTPASTPTQTPTMDPLSRMVRVPAGRFFMGAYTPLEADFAPGHYVYLDAFYIDEFEVTNEEYAACVKGNACNEPRFLSSRTRDAYYGNPMYSDYPVIFVTWHDAKNYCGWKGLRLPTEAEWEKAARWNSQRSSVYPWGSEQPNEYRAYFNAEDTTITGSFEFGRSYYGAYDMAGNVMEWVFDYYDPDYYSNFTDFENPPKNPRGPDDSPDGHVARGGSWRSVEMAELYTFVRAHFESTTAEDFLGFRCAVDANN
ncbi:MAG: formylglycine-generating enzyme family protein [Anaerolineales bacterium]|nr:formylglycine-generating enzyme family protein [Anaerolineales bacterium]